MPLDQNRKRRVLVATALFAPPIVFVVLSRLTYAFLVGGPLSSTFYPGPGYWLSAVVVLTVIGAKLWALSIGKGKRWAIVGYCTAMPVILLALQGAMSCLSGDCI